MAMYGKIYSGIEYRATRLSSDSTGQTMDNFLQDKVDNNSEDSIVSVFMLPYAIYLATERAGSGMWNSIVSGISRPSNIDGYTPRNKKLLTYPYCFLSLDCINDEMSFKYELFSDPNSISFDMSCALTPDPEIVIMPNAYGENVGNPSPIYSLTMKGFPQCAFLIDSYRSWLATRAGTDISSIIGSTFGMTSSAVSGMGSASATASKAASSGNIGAHDMSLVGSIASGLGMLANTAGITSSILGSLNQATKGNKIRGTQGAGTIFARGMLRPHIRKMSITKEYAKMIDDFFEVYGYAINRVDTPKMHITGRSYCYTQTSNCDIHGNIPSFDRVKIQSIFDRGVTFWTSLTNIGNYNTSEGT